MEKWFEIEHVEDIDSPALLIYPDRVTNNIRLLKKMVAGNTSRLRPHAKTHKMVEISKMLIDEGIDQFKCSTIAEAEMLAMSNAKDVLLAYQPIGPKVMRWIKLVMEYPNTHFSCIVDHHASVETLGKIANEYALKLNIYFDINVGMNRTGASENQIDGLWRTLQNYSSLHLEGVHGYDGQIHSPDQNLRESESNGSYGVLKNVYNTLQEKSTNSLKMVLGGSPSFSTHAKRQDVVCSPGTFVFWDWGYREKIPEQAFEYAAVLLTRVISIISENRICIDLGYKAVASDPPLPRVKFLNADDAIPAFQSEEHLVLDVKDSSEYPLGTVLYAVPTHICPTVALYDRVSVVKGHQKVATWQVLGRCRTLNI